MDSQKTGLQILIAEDETILRTLYSRTIGRAGHSLETTRTAEEAIQFLEARIPDFLITDNIFKETGGKMTGLELIAYLVDSNPDNSSRPPVLLVSGTHGQQEIEAYCRNKFGEYDAKAQKIAALPKPLNYAGLVAFLNDYRDTRVFDPMNPKYDVLFSRKRPDFQS